MSDKPILFSAPMVKALLAGVKTKTRRIFKPQPDMHDAGDCSINGHRGGVDYLMREVAPKFWSRVKVGDKLWVKETAHITSWSEYGEVWMTYAADETKSGILHPRDEDYLERLCARVEKAGAETNAAGLYENIPPSVLVKPSIHMPRWASRITLTVTDVRVQRLQEISEADAIAEGCKAVRSGCFVFDATAYDRAGLCHSSAVMAYSVLWDEINGEGSWDANPWCAAYTFTVALGNIDQIARAA